MEILDYIDELPRNTYNINYYSNVQNERENLDINSEDANIYQNSLPLLPYYPNDGDIRVIKPADVPFGQYQPLMESYQFSTNLYQLNGYNTDNYNLNAKYDLNASLNYNKNYEYIFNDTSLLNATSPNNVFNYNHSIGQLNELYETQFLSQINNSYMHDLYETTRYATSYPDNCNSDNLIQTIPQQQGPIHYDYSYASETPNSTDSGTDYEDINQEIAKMDFLNMSERKWERCKSSGLLKLGNKGRSQLKSKISKYLKKNPHMRKRVNKISGVRKATTRQLFQLAQICGITSHLTRH